MLKLRNRYMQVVVVLMILIGSFFNVPFVLSEGAPPDKELPDDILSESSTNNSGRSIFSPNAINYAFDSITLSFVANPSGQSFNDAVRIQRCGSANYEWLTSERLSPNAQRYGPWDKGTLSGCEGSYPIINWDYPSDSIWKVCAGASDSKVSSSDFYDHPNNRCYRVWRKSSGIGYKAIFDIAGKVTDSNGNAISGVTLTLSNGKTATSNSNGNYRFDNIDQDTYTVTPSKSGYVFNPASRSVTGPRQPLNTTPDVTGQNFTGTDQSTISGRVTDSGGGPIAGVTVSAGGGRTSTTDNSGNYTIGDLPAGSYTLTAIKTDYTFTPSSRAVTVPPNATGQNFVDNNRYAISGQVTDGSGNAISGVPVACKGLTWSKTVHSDSNGNYVCSGLIAGFYLIQEVVGSGYDLSPSAHGWLIVPPNRPNRDFTTTPQYGLVGGKVTVQGTSNAIRNARVSVGGRVGYTDANGNYSINNILPGTYNIYVSAGGYVDYRGSATILANASTTRNVSLKQVRTEGYRLPYPGGTTYRCSQGNNQGSHRNALNKYAFDFANSDGFCGLR